MSGVPVVVVGAVVLIAAGSADWLVTDMARTVGGIEVASTRTTPGAELAPLAVPLGLAAAVGAGAIGAFRGRVRVGVAIVVAVVGAAGMVAVGSGILLALSRDAGLTSAPWLALLGAGGIVAGGLRASGRPRPRPALGSRFDIDAPEGDDEWELAQGSVALPRVGEPEVARGDSAENPYHERPTQRQE